MDELNGRALAVRILTLMIARLASRDLGRRLQHRGAAISALQLALLRRLKHQSKATISELSAEMMLSPATLVPVVDALERKGLLARSYDLADRRRKMLRLTPEGSDMLEGLAALAEDDPLAMGLADMDDAKAVELVSLLRQLATEMTGDPGAVNRALAEAQVLSNE